MIDYMKILCEVNHLCAEVGVRPVADGIKATRHHHDHLGVCSGGSAVAPNLGHFDDLDSLRGVFNGVNERTDHLFQLDQA